MRQFDPQTHNQRWFRLRVALKTAGRNIGVEWKTEWFDLQQGCGIENRDSIFENVGWETGISAIDL